jgi:hypothetical protein
MITLGASSKITVPESTRAQVRAMADALGARGVAVSDRMEVFAGATGGSIGFQFVPDAEALTPAQMRIAPWLELAVDDVDAAGGRLEAIGIARLPYEDKTHAYFVGPGGLVFRLAAAPR